MPSPRQPNSRQARDIAHHFHPYTNALRHEETGPLVITRGAGVRVFDDEGKDYIEALAGLWCTALGWGEERLAQVAYDQMRRLPFYHAFGHKSHEPAIELAERLIALAPPTPHGPFSKVFFANSGSEANDTAIKLIRYYNNARGKPDKKKILSRHKAYHGVTLATASLTGLPLNHGDFDLPMPGILHLGCPHAYRFAEPGESPEDFASRRAEELETLILTEGPDTIAALFAEPVMGAGGVLVPPPTYFEKIQAVLRKYDILLVADEVICGFGRTGNRWGCDTFGIRPDLLTCAKGLSSGYLPISALLISEPVYTVVRDNTGRLGGFGHGFTYSGHPVAAAVAVETLKIYEERDILGQVRATAPPFQAALRRLGDHPLVGEARGVGLIGALELVADRATGAPFDPLGRVGLKTAETLQAHGVISRAMGDTLAFAPPLVIGTEDIGILFDRVGRALDEVHDWVVGEGLAQGAAAR
jgi:4-aminobutyrate--pyruvate transaminase